MKHLLFVVLSALLLQGCIAPGYKTFYSQVAPTKYPPTQHVSVFYYGESSIEQVRKLMYDDFLVIGRSDFSGPYENPSDSLSFAKSIGADVFITGAKFRNISNSLVDISTPTVNTSYVSGSSFSGTVTTYGTSTTTIPVSVTRYNQRGLFLKNVNHVLPVWQTTEAQYTRTGASGLDGIWYDEHYKLNVYRSGSQIVAFNTTQSKRTPAWGPGQLKFSYNAASGTGVYLMGSKAPEPAKFSINKFGHMEVTLLTKVMTFSFARQQR